MGAALYIVLDQPEPGFDAFVDGKALARNAEAIEELTSSASLRSPYDFCSQSEAEFADLSDEFDLDPDATPGGERWFTPAEGLEWVATVRRLIEQTADRMPEKSAVLADLAAYEDVFEKAKTVDARWHLAVDY